MFSKEVLDIDHLKLNIYGFNEYKTLPKNTPLGVVITLSGLEQTQYNVERLSQAICTLNNKRKASDIYIVVISMDYPFHGTRKDPTINANLPEPLTYTDQMYILDRNIDINTTAGALAGLIDVFESYVFGFHSEMRVQKWGIAGFSQGGYVALFTASIAPRISIVIVLSSGFDVQHLAHNTLQAYNLDIDYYLPKTYKENVERRVEQSVDRLKDVKLLILNGEEDRQFPESDNHSFINGLRETHNGREGYDWKAMVVPKNGHYISSAYIKLTVQWLSQWLLESPATLDSRL